MITFQPLNSSIIEKTVLLMQEFYAIDNYPIDVTVSIGLFQEFIRNENLGKAWLIFHNNEAVGYLILTFVFSFEYQGKIAFLDELYVIETARGKGIGSKAIDFIKAESHKLSLKLIYLEVEPHNTKAQKLYLASGFEMHNRKLMCLKTD
jgi:ribosomal protein S18 acetylase RimI-like enzyme